MRAAINNAIEEDITEVGGVYFPKQRDANTQQLYEEFVAILSRPVQFHHDMPVFPSNNAAPSAPSVPKQASHQRSLYTPGRS